MNSLKIDPHAHLYDSYDAQPWCEAALGNLGSGGIVVVVDRAGQDSCARLAKEVPAFATWSELPASMGGVVSWANGQTIIVVRGVQYVASERIEVLGLGVGRQCDDGERAETLLKVIKTAGGVACLPWSPGKWLGKRGDVVQGLLERSSPHDFVVGDIALRSTVGPYSLLLARAKRRGYSVVCGSDPLPRSQDQSLVGSFGMSIIGTAPAAASEQVRWALARLASGEGISVCGRRNGVLEAASRFLSAMR